MRYVSVVNTGVGFITHADKADLSFSGKPNDIWHVDGDSNIISTWIARVNGTEKLLTEADAQVFAVTKYIYTSREFLLEVLTSAEIKFLIDNYTSSLAIRNFFNYVLDNGADVSNPVIINFVLNVKNAGYLSQARYDEILAGRTS